MRAINTQQPTRAHQTTKRILVCAPSYLPGYKSGGPIRSIANVVARLSDRFDFYVVTRDRDMSDEQCYPQVIADQWCQVGQAHVMYCSSVSPALLYRAFQETQPDLIYLNSFQDAFTRAMVSLRRLGAFGNTPLLLAPRGEFGSAAMKIRHAKKALYRHAAKMLGLYDNLSWHVTNAHEKEDVLKAEPVRHIDPQSISVAGNICDAMALPVPHEPKKRGEVKLAFIARMCEMKNLCYLVDILPRIRGSIELNLFGPVSTCDTPYWSQCVEMIEQLPENFKVTYRGPIEPSEVPQVLHDHHFLVLPTKGENFCHAAVESFVNGTPVILSDATPWSNLPQVKAGFDIPLEDPDKWSAVLQACVDMEQTEYTGFLSGAKEYGRQFSQGAAVAEHLAMFEAAMKARPAA